jgi:hypothetical protein
MAPTLRRAESNPLRTGWLFLIPHAPGAWLLAVGSTPGWLLEASRVIWGQIVEADAGIGPVGASGAANFRKFSRNFH